VERVKSAVLEPDEMVTLWLPSLALLTKSVLKASVTVRFTVRLAATAREAVALNTTSAPSVTVRFPCRKMLTASASASGVAVTVDDARPFTVPATARIWKWYVEPLPRPVCV